MDGSELFVITEFHCICVHFLFEKIIIILSNEPEVIYCKSHYQYFSQKEEMHNFISSFFTFSFFLISELKFSKKQIDRDVLWHIYTLPFSDWNILRKICFLLKKTKCHWNRCRAVVLNFFFAPWTTKTQKKFLGPPKVSKNAIGGPRNLIKGA